MILFPPNQAPPFAGGTAIYLNASTEKSVLNSLRVMARIEKDLQTRLTRIGENIDFVLAAFAGGGIIASERMLAAIAERQNRQTGTAVPKRRALRAGKARPEFNPAA